MNYDDYILGLADDYYSGRPLHEELVFERDLKELSARPAVEVPAEDSYPALNDAFYQAYYPDLGELEEPEGIEAALGQMTTGKPADKLGLDLEGLLDEKLDNE